jgi:hypothetical protein
MLNVLRADDRAAEGEARTTACRLSDLQKDKPDKLGNTVREILWIETNYAIYCSDKGIYVHFSDSPEEERDQRKRFSEICPELCELRYLTAQMRGWNWWLPWLYGRRRHTLYEHNMAQALMLMMEDNGDKAKCLAQQTLAMAVRRVTSDNTVRYVRACFVWGIVLIGMGVATFWNLNSPEAMSWRPYLVGGMFGAVGAIFSIITHLEAFKLKPCDVSRMNHWMGAIRVVMGIMSAIALLLFADTLFSGEILRKLTEAEHITKVDVDAMKNVVLWQSVALLGFVGGFAERLIPSMLHQAADKMETAVGTPVQAVRSN